MLAGKRILIGIGGGIAVYRVAELARMLVRAGADVRCVMTAAACEFVTPLTFEALTGNPVHTQLFDLTAEREMGHIALARQVDAVIIAPATAGLLARLAHGIADDLLTTIMQVCEAPVLLAPAMNASMWASDATRRNSAILSERGIHMVGPESGELACGESGPGRLAQPDAIVAALQPLLTPALRRLIDTQALAGQRWVINAGPTREAWDDVRILTNRASGRLGATLADQAAMAGACVDLVAGPGTPDTLPAVRRSHVESAEQMLDACERAAAGAKVFIATAAVSDYRFARPHAGKLKRGDRDSIRVELVANPDIVARIAAMRERPTRVIAFAAESSDHLEHARAKLRRKRVDAVIANDISNIGCDSGGGWWIDAEKQQRIDADDKTAFAAAIIKHITESAR
jgi:phosphopantothenoylcysteine decarboxylase/phosphopantothenate--cysteine ligase